MRKYTIGARAWVVRLGLSAGLVVTGACYRYVPVATPDGVLRNEVVILEVSDRGRIALRDRFGGPVRKIEGALQSIDSSSLALRVTKVIDLNGVAVHWASESVTIGREHVSSMQLRRISRGRTTVTAATFAGAVIALTLGKTLNPGSGDLPRDGKPGGGDVSTRIPR